MHKAEKILPGFTDFRGVPISPPLSMDNWFNTSAFFSLSDARLLESSLYKYITECNNTELKNLKIKQVLSGNIYNSFACRFANQVEICVDVKGNLYACRGSFEPFNIIGNIDSFKYPIETNKFKSFNNRAYCRNCPLVGICKGICSQVPDRIVKKYCLSHYAYQRANLRIMLKLKFNMELLKIINNDFDKQFQHNLSYDDLIKSINKPNIIHISKAT